MKALARTYEDDFIVQLNRQEFAVLERLQKAITNEPEYERFLRRELDSEQYDLSLALAAVWKWTEGRFLLNKLENWVDTIRTGLEPDEPSD